MNKQPDTLGFLIGDVQRLMRRQFQQQLEGSCLTLAQARALVHIARSEGIRQVDLAERLDIQPITLARQLDQMADNGLVERRNDPNDRRAHQLHLTEGPPPIWR
ncbi:MarR family winged helix-turn-helix transcriptional regulator [Aeromonas caviae]